jgi:hypothetical protein
MIGLFDHTYGFVPEGQLSEAMSVWREAGFNVRDECLLHQGGKLSGFAQMTGTYLELISVVDEEEFRKQSTPEEWVQRSRGAPFALAAACRDASAVRNQLVKAVKEIPPVDIRYVESEPNGAPAWAIVDLPAKATPGVTVTIIEYLRRGSDWATPICGENGVYGIDGYFLCADNCERAVDAWEVAFRPAINDLNRDANTLRCGHQTLTWLSGREYAKMFKFLPPTEDLSTGGICAVGLLSVCLERTAQAFSAAGIRVYTLDDGRLATAPDPRTGYAFVVDSGLGAEQLANEVNRRLAL